MQFYWIETRNAGGIEPGRTAIQLVFLNGYTTLTNFQFNARRLGFFTIGVNAKADNSDKQGSDNQIQTVTVQNILPRVLRIGLGDNAGAQS